MKGLLIPTDGVAYAVDIDPTDRLAALQRYVGGWIEGVPTDETVTVYCNEEGKIHGLPLNYTATRFARRFGNLLPHSDVLRGDVIVLGPTDGEGEDTDVPGSYIQALRLVWNAEPDVVKQGDRSRETRWYLYDGHDDNHAVKVYAELYTAHDKDRKRFFSSVRQVQVGDVFTKFDLFDAVGLDTAPVARFSAKALDEFTAVMLDRLRSEFALRYDQVRQYFV